MPEITPEQLTSLETVTRTAATRASEALSKLIGIPVKLEMTRTRVVEVEQLAKILVSPEEQVSAVMLPIVGEGLGSSALISSMPESHRLAELMMKKQGSLTKLDDLANSVLKEVANIIGGAFLTVFSNATGISLVQSVPSLLIDTIKGVVDAAITKLNHENGKISVAFEVDFELNITTTTTTTTTTTEKIITHYIFFLEVAFAQKLLEALKK